MYGIKLAVVCIVCALQLFCNVEGKTSDYCKPTSSCWPSRDQIDDFGDTIFGDIVLPDDALYINVTRGVIQPERWQANPGLVVFVENIQDVQACVRFAKKFFIQISIVTSGHEFIGRNTAEGSLQINLSRLQYFFINLNDRSSHTGMSCTTDVGNRWAYIYEQVSGKYNKLIVGGNSGTVSPAGYTLGGGKSLLSKMFGLAVDNVLEMTVVNAQAQILRVYPTYIEVESDNGAPLRLDDTDLFWALRGGGGSTFAILTRIKYRIYEPPADGFTSLRALYPFRTSTSLVANEVLDFLFSYIRGLPKEACGSVLVDSPYDGSDYKSIDPTNGQIYVTIEYFGGYKDAMPVLKPLLDFRPDLKLYRYTPQVFPNFWEMRKDNLYTGYTGRTYMFSTLIQDDGLNKGFADMLVKSLLEVQTMGLIMECEGAILGGKMREYPPEAASVPPSLRYGLMTWACGAYWFDDGIQYEDQYIAQLQTFHQRLLDAGTGVYFNEASDILENWKTAQWGIQYQRLFAIKLRWDPFNWFSCHHCVGSDMEDTDVIPELERGGKVITDYCQPEDPCWPTTEEVLAFCQTLSGDCVLPGDPLYINATVGTVMPERWVANPGIIIYVANLQDIQKSVVFARRYRIRISVITSGHDFIGRNTADGSMQINLSRLQYLFVDLSDDSSDSGMSCTTDVGNNWAKLYGEVSGRYNKIIVGGNSGTVSPAGYTLGGGKSLLSKMFGLAVDNVLEFTIVNAQAQIVHVYPTYIVIENAANGFTRIEDPDLFWALRGGGGGTFAIVTRVKYRIFDPPSGGFTMLRGLYPFQTNNGVVANEVLDFMFSYIRGLPQEACGYVLVDSPYPGSQYQNVSATTGQIYIVIEYFGGKEQALPTLNTLYNYRPELKLYDYKPVNFASFWAMRKDHLYTGYRGRTYMFSSVIQDDGLDRGFADMLVSSLREVEAMGLIMECEGAILGGKMRDYSDTSSSVGPGFRQGLMTWSCGAFWFDDDNDIEDTKIAELQPFHQRLLDAGSGVYLNEASDILEDWKQLQWGTNYDRLLGIKKKWDPVNIFTCHHCVGSDQVPVTQPLT